MAHKSLTDLAARNAKGKEKPYKLAVGAGLYLQVMPSGNRYWRTRGRTDVFNYIEMFYNPICQHGFAGNLAPVELSGATRRAAHEYLPKSGRSICRPCRRTRFLGSWAGWPIWMPRALTWAERAIAQQPTCTTSVATAG